MLGFRVAQRTIRYLSTVAFGLTATPALADTTVGGATTTPLATSTAGNVTIASGGSVTPGGAGAAVTIDSNATVSNAGSITSRDISNSIGILANPGVTSGITNSHMDPTVASFAGGSDFALTPEARKAGWLGNVRLKGGSRYFAVNVDVGEERQQDHTGVAGKMGLTLAF